MKEENKNQKNEPKERFSVLLTDKEQQEQKETEKANQQQYKKWLVYSLMVLAFLGCMYLLFFNEDTDKKNAENQLNDIVPEASNISLPEDKKKIYEESLTQEKEKKQKETLETLSDYWEDEIDNTNSTVSNSPPNPRADEKIEAINASVESYQRVNQTLGSFYEEESNDEQEQMQREIDSLKEQLAQKETHDPLETQMALMEKSYQMAAKYMPTQSNTNKDTKIDTIPNKGKYVQNKADITPVYTVNKSVVSRLPRNMSDSLLLENWLKQNRQGFNNMESQKGQTLMYRNSIKACIHTEQLIDKNNRIPLRLLEPVRVSGMVLPKGTLLTASAKIGEGRLLLDINSLEYQGLIVSVAITAYDLDGQRGLYLPYTPGANAFREIAAGLSQSSGTNYTFNSSAKEQVLSEVSKGVLQGVSSYISKKIAQPKIRIKAGYQVLLVTNN